MYSNNDGGCLTLGELRIVFLLLILFLYLKLFKWRELPLEVREAATAGKSHLGPSHLLQNALEIVFA